MFAGVAAELAENLTEQVEGLEVVIARVFV